jgi:hypothetical protein
MQRDVLLLTEMIDAAEQAHQLTADITVSQLEARPPAPRRPSVELYCARRGRRTALC